MLSIITPLFNRSDLTAKFLENWYTYRENSELILVDNGSSDNTMNVVRVFKKMFPNADLRYIQNPENHGFGGGNNIGAKLAKYDNLAFISNDVEIKGAFVSKIVNTLQDKMILGCRKLDYDTGWNTFIKDGKQITIPYLEGWAVFCKYLDYVNIGTWDENIFLDYEDLAFSYSATQLGMRLETIDLPLVHNHPGSSFKELGIERINFTLASRRYFMEKWNLHDKSSN